MSPGVLLYADLLKRRLTRIDSPEVVRARTLGRSRLRRAIHTRIVRGLERRGQRVVEAQTLDPAVRAVGGDWPAEAETMIGLRRLDNVQDCVLRVLAEDVPGDLIETGVWRGGAVILMRGLLAASGDTTRRVWVADSFRGLPPPDPAAFPADAGDRHHEQEPLAVSQDDVAANFARYGLLDDQVRFLPGWFKDTLPTAPIDALSVLRLDGDMYESTITALEALYPKLSPGGFCIVDDYGAIPACRAAVDDYRRDHGVTEAMEEIDWTGVFWRRGGTG